MGAIKAPTLWPSQEANHQTHVPVPGNRWLSPAWGTAFSQAAPWDFPAASVRQTDVSFLVSHKLTAGWRGL